MYWIAGTRPVLDGGVADNGMPFGAPTDEVERFVALVWLNTDEEDDGTYNFRFEAVDGWDTGSVTDYDHVTHFMECEAPAFPGEAAPAQEEQDGPLPDEQPSCRKCDGARLGLSARTAPAPRRLICGPLSLPRLNGST
ncbi:hypothetical protein SSTU70S_04919 [Stutzerimonas stutzeri]